MNYDGLPGSNGSIFNGLDIQALGSHLDGRSLSDLNGLVLHADDHSGHVHFERRTSRCPRPHRWYWSARPDLGWRWSSRLVATTAENRLSFRRKARAAFAVARRLPSNRDS